MWPISSSGWAACTPTRHHAGLAPRARRLHSHGGHHQPGGFLDECRCIPPGWRSAHGLVLPRGEGFSPRITASRPAIAVTGRFSVRPAEEARNSDGRTERLERLARERMLGKMIKKIMQDKRRRQDG